MADLNIDEAKALNWIYEVQCEVSRVRQILGNVSRECSTVAGEEDTIMKGIVNVGETLNNFWDSMCNGFESATKSIKDVISKVGTAVGEIVDDIGNVKSKIGQ